MQRSRLVFLVAVLAAAVPAGAQAPPGEDFAVNAYTTGSQHGVALAADGRGNFVAVWTSDYQDGSSAGIFGRRFDRLGTPRGPEFQVNVATYDSQLLPSVASDAAGNFMVVWRTIVSPGLQLLARSFDAAGAPRSGEVALTPLANTSSDGMVTMHPDGNALAVWHSPLGVRGRRFDAAGAPMGNELTIHAGSGVAPEAAPTPDGYIVAWTDGFPADVLARRLDASGTPLGTAFRVNTYTTGSQESTGVAVDGAGGFVVTWINSPGSGPTEIQARRFDASGSPIGPPVGVSNTPAPCCARVTSDRTGNFTVLWGDANTFDTYARRLGPTGIPLGPQFVVPSVPGYFTDGGDVRAMPGGHTVLAYTRHLADGSFNGVLGRVIGTVPMALSVDDSALPANGNGVLEPGETVGVVPSWANGERDPVTMTGTLSEFGGPGSSTYTIDDAAARYGTANPSSTVTCATPADCYAVSVSAPSVRPAVHWDAAVRERVTGLGDQTWSLHVGGSFTDVHASSPVYRFVETLLHHGVSGGCTADQYCPNDLTTREQVAVFVLAAKDGGGYRPPACTTPLFADVPAGSPFCRYVEELARRGVVAGCGNGEYCPSDPVSRQQMAVFVLRTLDPTLDPPACTTPMFGDVPASSPFCRWIEELARRGVVTGCGTGNYCPALPVTREQMAVFVSATFGLTLYGP